MVWIQGRTCEEKIASYIRENHISVQQTCIDTGIDPEMLQGKNDKKMTATEFLELCMYLDIRPEDMR